jgi:regulator of sigma E protease
VSLETAICTQLSKIFKNFTTFVSITSWKVIFAAMIALIKGLQLLLSLSLLVVLHELGHYLAARYFKTRVEKFYLFMNPGFSLFKKQIGDTEWGIGWLPLGGYVKISGMIDESMDKEQMAKPAEPWEFRSKPAWQRLIIMLGGIIVNLIVGFLIYSMILLVWGQTILPNKYAVDIDPRLEVLGFQSGDQIISFNGEELETFRDVRTTAFFEPVNEAVVKRNGVEKELSFTTELGQVLIDEGIRRPFSLQVPPVIKSIDPDSRAKKAGLMAGDLILEVNGDLVFSQQQTVNAFQSYPNSPVVVHIERQLDQSLIKFSLPVMTDSLGHIGFMMESPANFSEMFVQEKIEYGAFDALVSGFIMAGTTLQEYALSLRFLASKSGASQVGSLITFGSIFDGGWDWLVFWRNTAFFSIILAFMNLLPIPALDGGHVMFLLYEIIVGKPAPEKIMEIAQVIGITLLLGLMVFALGNDFWRLFTGGFG